MRFVAPASASPSDGRDGVAHPHDGYVPPVGFAREPQVERKRWIGRILLLAFVSVLMWLLIYRVISPQEDTPTLPRQTSSPLPGPI